MKSFLALSGLLWVILHVGLTAATPNRLTLKRHAQRYTRNPVFEDPEASQKIANGSSNATVQYNRTWAGAIIIDNDFKLATANVVIQNSKVPAGSKAGTTYATTTWVGIDGFRCSTQALLQTGVDTYISNGVQRFEAWYEWYPGPSIPFTPALAIKTGDVINMTVIATSTTSGTAIVENVTTGKSVRKDFLNQKTPLCLNSAEWIVEDFTSTAGLKFADFNTVTFMNATAITSKGVMNAKGAQIVGIKQNNKIMTDCKLDDDSTITCNYVS